MAPCWIQYSERRSRGKNIISKCFLKTNTKGHKHPSIRLFIIEQDTVGKQNKTVSGIQHGKYSLFGNPRCHINARYLEKDTINPSTADITYLKGKSLNF